MKSTRGAKGKYTPALVNSICKVIRTGGSDSDAITLAGIHPDTFYTWLKEKPEFSVKIARARLLGKMERIERIKVHGQNDWRADAWYLERRYPQEYAQQLVIRVDPGDMAVLKQMGFATPAEAWLAFMQNAREEYATSDADS